MTAVLSLALFFAFPSVASIAVSVDLQAPPLRRNGRSVWQRPAIAPRPSPNCERPSAASTNSDLKKLAGLHGLRCSMIRNQPLDAQGVPADSAARFPARSRGALPGHPCLRRPFLPAPRKTLMRDAPFSYHAHELMAETLEQQGKWDAGGRRVPQDPRNQFRFARDPFPPRPRPAVTTQSHSRAGTGSQAGF